MNLNILQWNIKGYFNNYSNFELLCKRYNPHIFSLQETYIKSNFNAHAPKQYVGYFVHQSLQHKTLTINSNISAVAVEINLHNPITIISVYIPPLQNLTVNDLNNLIINIQTPIILTGDFNGWSPLWGSLETNPRGKIIEDFILSNNISLLNDGSYTHFTTCYIKNEYN